MTNRKPGEERLSHPAYKGTGVDTTEADLGLGRIVACIKETWGEAVRLDIGYFANVIDFGGLGVAISTDGVGSKTIIADMMGRYDTIGIDCVAMNVNDVVCVGARPLSLVDYIAVERADAAMLGEIARGLSEGAKRAGISISGGEIAQLKDVVRGFDLVGTAIGRVDLDKVLVGQDVREGDVVIGVASNGIHSNGLSLARKAFFELNGLGGEHRCGELDCSLGEELLKPTHIYVQEAMAILERVPGVKAFIHITGDGLLNLTRVAAPVGYVLEGLPEPPPIFPLIQRHAGVADAEMFAVFNMGVGFCVVVDAGGVEGTLAVLKAHGRAAWRIGHAVADAERRVRIPARGLVGRGKTFAPA